MQPYSLDLRTRVAAACQLPGACKTAVARRFSLSRTFVQSLLRQQRETGSLAPQPARGGRARFLDAAAQAWLGRTWSSTQMSRWPNPGPPGRPVAGGPWAGPACGRCWPSSGCAAKKSLHATERDSPRVREARGQYVQAVVPRPDLARFHFLDETGLRLDQCRRYARARGGQRVGQAVPRKRGRSLTLIGALSVGGLHGVQLLSAPLNQRSFGLYIARILAPQLRRGHVLVLDNLRVHHLTGVREWLGKRGVERLFLPPYSPDFSPIEQAWSKLKTKLRTAQARTEQALQTALHEAITWISSADARHWFAHCGYHVPPR